ncbi:FAD-dependent monooxygenase [Streptomyces albidoflavus]
MLRGHAAAAGVAVEWSTRLESFQQDEEAVTAVLRGGEGTDETVRARYLWGCDGGHSTVRKTLRLPLTGEPAHTWLINRRARAHRRGHRRRPLAVRAGRHPDAVPVPVPVPGAGQVAAAEHDR